MSVTLQLQEVVCVCVHTRPVCYTCGGQVGVDPGGELERESTRRLRQRLINACHQLRRGLPRRGPRERVTVTSFRALV